MSSLRKTTIPTKSAVKKPFNLLDNSNISSIRNDSISSIYSTRTKSANSTTLDIDLKKNTSDDLVKKIEVTFLNFYFLEFNYLDHRAWLLVIIAWKKKILSLGIKYLKMRYKINFSEEILSMRKAKILPMTNVDY